MKRIIKYGDRFRPEELERGEVELLLPEQAPEPEHEMSEPWARERNDDDG